MIFFYSSLYTSKRQLNSVGISDIHHLTDWDFNYRVLSYDLMFLFSTMSHHWFSCWAPCLGQWRIYITIDSTPNPPSWFVTSPYPDKTLFQWEFWMTKDSRICPIIIIVMISAEVIPFKLPQCGSIMHCQYCSLCRDRQHFCSLLKGACMSSLGDFLGSKWN